MLQIRRPPRILYVQQVNVSISDGYTGREKGLNNSWKTTFGSQAEKCFRRNSTYFQRLDCMLFFRIFSQPGVLAYMFKV